MIRLFLYSTVLLRLCKPSLDKRRGNQVKNLIPCFKGSHSVLCAIGTERNMERRLK
jgi:hypothetical protein